jgi:hypothetical protein
MDLDRVKQHLAQADRHIAEGREPIDKQTAIVAQLEQDGHDTCLARQLLDPLEDTLQKQQQHREEILRELELYGNAREDPRSPIDPQQNLE